MRVSSEDCEIPLLLHENLSHHAAVLVVENMAGVYEFPCNAKLHLHGDIRIGSAAVPGWNSHGVEEFGICHRLPVNRRHQEVNLVHVKRVRLAGRRGGGLRRRAYDLARGAM